MSKKILFLPWLFFYLSLSYAGEQANCQALSNNFSYELSEPLTTTQAITGWGLRRNALSMSPAVSACLNDLNWARNRILAAADYWVKQKINYCHHYVPTYLPPVNQRSLEPHGKGYCSQAKDIMPNSPFYGQTVRWNYNGNGSDTMNNWLNETMWQGLDCSNYTAFLYDFAFGLTFTGNVQWQAGQRKGGMQKNLSPNQQSPSNVLDNPQAAGTLVCGDNTLEVNHSCNNHGGYLSVIDNLGQKRAGSITANQLGALPLQAGDLLFISAASPYAVNPLLVTHVVMWTGKRVGYGPNDILPQQIAPNGLCPESDWTPKVGDWVITDSHYQGPDYRILTPCFYLNNLWGVRRVL